MMVPISQNPAVKCVTSFQDQAQRVSGWAHELSVALHLTPKEHQQVERSCLAFRQRSTRLTQFFSLQRLTGRLPWDEAQFPLTPSVRDTLELAYAIDVHLEWCALCGERPSSTLEEVAAGSPAYRQGLQALFTALRQEPDRLIRIGLRRLPACASLVSVIDLYRVADTLAIGELQRMVKGSPVLAAAVLQAANSGLISRGPITSLDAAIVRLGIQAVLPLILRAAAQHVMSSVDSSIWSHSVRVARQCQQLAPAAGVDPDTAYTTGLLHDVGRVLLLVSPVSAEYRRLLQQLPPTVAEWLLVEVDHGELGARLLQQLGVPELIVQAVAEHHAPRPTTALASVLSLAERSVRTREALPMLPLASRPS